MDLHRVRSDRKGQPPAFIPVQTVARAGGQPFATLASYKTAAYANGDFAGLSAVTTFAPNVKTSIAYVIVEDQLAGGNRALAPLRTSRGKDYALIFSPEVTPFKGLDVKPLFSYFHADGLTSSNARGNHANIRTVGGTTNGIGAGVRPRRRRLDPPRGSGHRRSRHAVAVGPFGFDPTSITSGERKTARQSGPTARPERSRPT